MNDLQLEEEASCFFLKEVFKCMCTVSTMQDTPLPTRVNFTAHSSFYRKICAVESRTKAGGQRGYSTIAPRGETSYVSTKNHLSRRHKKSLPAGHAKNKQITI